MKTLLLLVELACIVSTSIVSASLYLKGEHNLSSLLILTSLISLSLWVKSNGLLDDKKIVGDSTTAEVH
jgi:hypothetical protein